MTFELGTVAVADFRLFRVSEVGILAVLISMAALASVVEAAYLIADIHEMKKPKNDLDVTGMTRTPQHHCDSLREHRRGSSCLHGLMTLVILIPSYRLIYLNYRAAQPCSRCNTSDYSQTQPLLYPMSSAIYHCLV